jgi:type III restriction enzyme
LGPRQGEFDFDLTGERREANQLVNQLRGAVGRWRGNGYPWVTPVTRNLLLYWADEARDNRVLFCQREAAETAIYLSRFAAIHAATSETANFKCFPNRCATGPWPRVRQS